MKLTKREETWGTSIYLEEGDQTLCISFGGNLDLYWTIRSKNKYEFLKNDETTSASFTITKENYDLYSEFENLFSMVENIDIFIDEVPVFVEDPAEIEAYIKEYDEYISQRKKEYRERNLSRYNDLYNPLEKKITWYSDETNMLVANYVEIKKVDDEFHLGFYTQPYIEGYDMDDHYAGCIPIRFRNSGSHYDPLNIIFMKMYSNLQELDDVNDKGHQIRIEEYLYGQAKEKKKDMNFRKCN